MPSFANPMPSAPAPTAQSMSSMSSPGGFDSILQFLGNLLTNKQSNQASQFGQEFGLQQQRQQQAAQAQQFGQQQQTRLSSFDYLNMMASLQKYAQEQPPGTPGGPQLNAQQKLANVVPYQVTRALPGL